MISRKANPLTLKQSENYSFVASFDKISSNTKKFYSLKFSNFLGVSKALQKICMVSKKNVELMRNKYFLDTAATKYQSLKKIIRSF